MVKDVQSILIPANFYIRDNHVHFFETAIREKIFFLLLSNGRSKLTKGGISLFYISARVQSILLIDCLGFTFFPFSYAWRLVGKIHHTLILSSTATMNKDQAKYNQEIDGVDVDTLATRASFCAGGCPGSSPPNFFPILILA